jgi:NAD(P)H-dependent FMN reductase
MNVLGICGSLRSASSNSRLLEAARSLMPAGSAMHVTSRIAALPLFNPDLDYERIDAVREWAAEMKAADGVVISTPEYARGYPGALKNALDWLVNTDAFVNKPFMFLGASDRSTVGRDSLAVVLETMSGIHIESASTTLPLLGRNLEVADIVGNGEMTEQIRQALRTFVTELQARARAQPPA